MRDKITASSRGNRYYEIFIPQQFQLLQFQHLQFQHLSISSQVNLFFFGFVPFNKQCEHEGHDR